CGVRDHPRPRPRRSADHDPDPTARGASGPPRRPAMSAPAAAAPAIDIRGLTKRYVTNGSEMTALEDVDLTVRDGEFVSLIGPSGCGKTTLLKIIDGLIPFDSG